MNLAEGRRMLDSLRFLRGLAACVLVASSPALAQTPPPQALEAERLLDKADAALSAGNDVEARKGYQEVLERYPGTPSAALAQRSLSALKARITPPPMPPAPPPSPAAAPEAPPEATEPAEPEGPPPSNRSDLVYAREPYSLRTKERIHLSTWEKVDFVSTAFSYGGSVGFSYALALKSSSTASILGPVVLGAGIYTLGAVGYLLKADPDRGDLPLLLSITSYLPTTMAFALSSMAPNLDPGLTGWLVAGTGTVAIPIALLAAYYLDLDPGDMQLVRDAGFWGMVLGLAGAAGFGQSGSFGGLPPWQGISAAGLVGLYVGLGLGGLSVLLKSDVSLERVRVTTWGGYGGAVVGTLIAVAATANQSNSGQAAFAGGTIGAALGLAVTFAATGSLDAIPADAKMLSLAPTLSPLAGPGQSGMTFGLRSSF
jgi:hypothetical protein